MKSSLPQVKLELEFPHWNDEGWTRFYFKSFLAKFPIRSSGGFCSLRAVWWGCSPDQQDSSLPSTNQIRGSSIFRMRSSLPVRAPKNLSTSSNLFLFLFLFSVKLYGLGPDETVPSSVRVRKCQPPRVLTHKSQPLILRIEQTASTYYLFTRFSHPASARWILRKS